MVLSENDKFKKTEIIKSIEDIEKFFNEQEELSNKENLKNLFDGVFKRLKDSKYFSKTLTIKIRFSNRETIQKSKSLRDYSKNYLDLLSLFNELLEEIDFSKEILLAHLSLPS